MKVKGAHTKTNHCLWRKMEIYTCLLFQETSRSVAQPGRVLVSGARGPGFESPHSDHNFFNLYKCLFGFAAKALAAGSFFLYKIFRYIITFIKEMDMKLYAKTSTYGIMHMVVSFCVAYLVTGESHIALGISLLEPVAQIVFYFIHEHVWEKLKPGSAKKGPHVCCPETQMVQGVIDTLAARKTTSG